MPVDLKKIPAEEPLPVAPDKFRWLLTIVLCVIAGAVVVLALWPKHLSTRSEWFWFCTLMLPLSVGFMGYIIRLRRYENERDRVLWWNHLYQKQYEEQILLGQKAVGVLGMSYVTPVARNKLAVALLQGGSGLHTHYSPAIQSTLTTASIIFPSVTLFTEANYQTRLESILASVIGQLHAELVQFTGNLFVRIHHDGVLNDEHILTIWRKIFPASYAVNDITVSTDNSGLMWLDGWLDRRDEALVLSVEINLFLQARNQEAESVSALLLASPAWLTCYRVMPQMWIHRPVVIAKTEEAVADVALWGKITTAVPWFFWRAQVKGSALTAALLAMDKLAFLSEKKGEMVLEDTFGRPGAAVGNITLICACEHVVISEQTQWLMVGDETTQMVIVRPA
ncbi:hypothetical protein D4N07_11180 [Enterobacter hormaechei]|uniref:hypothetical protein n=1 Tax=Enterobacter hormaechei TaxID=158836 RepID=UPI0011DC9E73|nr:hypothetical protein [Enterobacter hormaechei]TXU04845.1 hypothetical protein D4N07_11180 [Enterobacter hormaechei]